MKSTRMLEKDAASLWDQDKLPAFAIFKAEQEKKKKKITQTHFQTDAPSKQQATARSIGGCHRVLRTKGRGSLFFFPYGTTASGLCKKSSSFLLLSLTRARTGAVYIANSRGRGRGRRKVNRSPKSKVSWWKKGFKQCWLLYCNKRLSCFDSDFPLAHCYIPIWGGYALQPLCCEHLSEQLQLP